LNKDIEQHKANVADAKKKPWLLQLR